MNQTNNYPWLEDFCLSLTAASKDFKLEWNATRYLIGEKMFAMLCTDKEGAPIITFKLEPAFGFLLREQYEHIVAGYYMNKEHWNSLYLGGTVPDDVVKSMAQQSHHLILKSLSKNAQKELGLDS